MLIDGRTASQGGRRYGIFEIGLEVEAGQTNVLPYTIWLAALDTTHAVTIASPTMEEVVITTPRLPGLEVRLPAGTVIRDHEGRVVREVSITPIPLDRPPFPLPRGVEVPFYFTVQPGAAYLTNSTYRGARLIYPSTDGVLPGTRVNFWNYDAGGRGWYVYGLGTAMPDGGGIVPDPRVSVYEFTGAMVAGPGQKPAQGPPPGGNTKGGDPVDLSTGLFVLEKTDLVIPDVIPIVLRRTYRPGDTWSRAFGVGTTHPYDMLLVGDTFPYTSARQRHHVHVRSDRQPGDDHRPARQHDGQGVRCSGPPDPADGSREQRGHRLRRVEPSDGGHGCQGRNDGLHLRRQR